MEKGKDCFMEEITQYCEAIFHQLKKFFLNIKKQKMVLTQHQLGKSYLDLKSANRCILPREECAEADPAQVHSAHAGQAAAVHTGPKASCAGLGWPPGMQNQLSPPSFPLPRQLLLLWSTWLQNSSLLKYQLGLSLLLWPAVIGAGGMRQWKSRARPPFGKF